MSAAASRGITTLFWDVGGVILSNGWDTAARARAAAQFQFDGAEVEIHHAAVFPDYEAGKITLDDYLARAVFFCARSFSKEDFRSFMLAQSTENPASRELLDSLVASRLYLMATINNEGGELNEYRIRKFDLTRNFSAFFSSCYVGLRKPDEVIYRLALQVTQRVPERSIFIDDREENLVGARGVGMKTIRFENPAQLREELARNGVTGIGE